MPESAHDSLHPLLKVVKSPVRNVYFFAFIAVAFLGFAGSEIYSAVYANSLSLLGDSMALTVEILTFVLILLGDLIKHRSGSGELSYPLFVSLEIVLPFVFLSGLAAAIVYILLEASVIISENGEGYLPVNTTYLYLFSGGNFIFHLMNANAFHSPCGSDVQANQSEERGGESIAGDEANQAFLRGPDATAAAADNENISSVDRRNNSYGTNDYHESGTTVPNDSLAKPPIVVQLNQTLLNIVTMMGIDVLRGSIVLTTAIIISATSVSSPYADAIAAILVVLTMLPMFVPFCFKWFCSGVK